VPAAFPARRRAGVLRVCALPEREEVDRLLLLPERDEPPEREEEERELDDRELDERELDDRDEPPEREPPEPDDPPERDEEEREPDEELRELDPLERLPFEDPPLLPPDDSAMVLLLLVPHGTTQCARDYFMPAVQTTHEWSESCNKRPSADRTSRTSSGNLCGVSTTSRSRSSR
jgi:hypothetical protein